MDFTNVSGDFYYAAAIRREFDSNLWNDPGQMKRNQFKQEFLAKMGKTSKKDEVRKEILAKVGKLSGHSPICPETKQGAGAGGVDSSFSSRARAEMMEKFKSVSEPHAYNPYITQEATAYHGFAHTNALANNNNSALFDIGTAVWIIDHNSNTWRSAIVEGHQGDGYMVRFTRYGDDLSPRSPRSAIWVPSNRVQVFDEQRKQSRAPRHVDVPRDVPYSNGIPPERYTKKEVPQERYTIEEVPSERYTQNEVPQERYTQNEVPQERYHKEVAPERYAKEVPPERYSKEVSSERYSKDVSSERYSNLAPSVRKLYHSVQKSANEAGTQVGSPKRQHIGMPAYDIANQGDVAHYPQWHRRMQAGAGSGRSEEVMSFLRSLGIGHKPYCENIANAFEGVSQMRHNYSYKIQEEVEDFQRKMKIDTFITAMSILQASSDRTMGKVEDLQSAQTAYVSPEELIPTKCSLQLHELFRIEQVIDRYLAIREPKILDQDGKLAVLRSEAISFCFHRNQISELEKKHLENLLYAVESPWHKCSIETKQEVTASVKRSLSVLGIPRSKLSKRAKFLRD